MDREKLIEICEKLSKGCKENVCNDCDLYQTSYPRCRATYMADRIIEALEVEKNDRAERLIELINDVKDIYQTIPIINGMRQDSSEVIADHLLSNGVIVPPCKVGDKVYKITRNKVKECEVTFIGLSADERYSHFNFVERYANGTFYKSYSMFFDVIGKTVFLTKEEAEKALKERKEK